MIIYYPKQSKKSYPLVFGLLGCIVGLVTMVFVLREEAKMSPIVSPIAQAIEHYGGTQLRTLPIPIAKKPLSAIIDETLDGTTDTYGIAIKNLGTQETFYRNEHQVFEPASLYKLWVMGTIYEAIEQGKFKKDQVLSDSVTDLNASFSIGPEDAELTEGTVVFSVSDAINQMITISHNYAALLLSKKLQMTTVSNYLDEHGLRESEIGQPPETTPADIALFLEKLYHGELANAEDTQEMLAIMKKQQLNQKIPLYLPPTLPIAHKTGELRGFSHDAGIIFSPKGDYILVVMSESDIPADAEKHIAQLSKAVYDYFNTY